MTSRAERTRKAAIDRALRAYRSCDTSLGRAAEKAALTQWELLDAARAAGVEYPLTGGEARERLRDLFAERA